MVRSVEKREAGRATLGPAALLYGGLLALAGVALAALAPLLRYTDSAAPEGMFFQQHKTTFMPLYTLLQAQPGAGGLLALLIGGLWYGALAGLYILLLRRATSAATLVDALWRSRAHWAAAGLAWLGALLAFPLLSDDTLYYLLGARAWLRGFNPYLPESVAAMMADSVHSLMGGSLLPFTYGPLWLYLSLLPAALSGGSFGAALLGVKLLNVALAGLCLLVLWRLLDDRPTPIRRQALLALVWHRCCGWRWPGAATTMWR